MNTLRCICISSMVLGLLSGCGGKTKYPLVAVTGTIRYSDKTTLPKGTKLLFSPNEGGMGTASAVTEEDGSFKVVHASGADGAEVGKYAVSLQSPVGQEQEFFKTISPEYVDGKLSLEVKAGMGPVELTVGKARKSR